MCTGRTSPDPRLERERERERERKLTGTGHVYMTATCTYTCTSTAYLRTLAPNQMSVLKRRRDHGVRRCAGQCSPPCLPHPLGHLQPTDMSRQCDDTTPT